jgi:hypothetical protein
VACANCNQDNPGKEYRFHYGKVVEEGLESTKYQMEGFRDVFICDDCARKHFTLRSRGAWLSMLGVVLCIVGLILVASLEYSWVSVIGAWVFGILAVAGFVAAIVFVAPLIGLLFKTRVNMQSSTRGKQEAMERLAIVLARPGKEYVCFTGRDVARLKLDTGES